MELANYYVVLGVGPDANLSQIKRAFRQLCQECHPDHNPEGNQQFLEAQEAYDALKDPLERARHDQQLATPQTPQTSPHVVAQSPIDLIRDFSTYSPSADEIEQLFLQNYTHHHEPKATHARELNLEVVLTPHEAVRGGTLSLSVPILRACPTCNGTGRAGSGVCEECQGHGSEQQQAQVDVIIPRRAADGQVIPVSLSHLGIRNLYLSVHIRVAPENTWMA